MAQNKRFYWLKLKDDFFKDLVIKKLRKIAGGDTYTIIYLKLLLLSLKNEGKLYFEGVEETFVEEMALELDEDTDNVSVTLNYLQKNGLIEMVDSDEYLLTETKNITGCESASALRVRRHREQKKGNEALQCNTTVTPLKRQCNKNVTPEIEKEKELRDKNIIPPLTPQEGSGEGERKTPKSKFKNSTFPALFLQFWEAYPKKCNKDSALKAWNNIPDPAALLSKMLETIRGFAQSSEWKRDGGRYIPYAATWLNHRRWDDEIPKPMQYCDDNNKSAKPKGTNQFLKMALAEMEEVEDAEK